MISDGGCGMGINATHPWNEQEDSIYPFALPGRWKTGQPPLTEGEKEDQS